MDCTPNRSDESNRLNALRRYQILDTPVEQDFDDFTALVAQICKAPIAVINLIDEDRQWFKSERGLGVRETPLDVSICRHAILQKGLFVVPDTREDDRFKNNPLVTGEPHLRFYAGALLESSDGYPLGTLCVLDYKPRNLTESEGQALEVLARQVMTAMELRLKMRELEARNEELESALQQINTLEGLLSICAECKKIRNDKDEWIPVESFMEERTEARFSHGLCPVCSQEFLDQLEKMK
ncbi:MAG: GAF domain-containing protein [Opitutales bacterium]|nr:GAF domain-containing protein [Opitutales bacterium]